MRGMSMSLSHRFGEPLTCKVESSLFVSKLANEDEPFYARFIFRYRPNGESISRLAGRMTDVLV